MMVICNLPSDWKPADFHPFPGGRKSRKMGCTCSYQPFENGQIAYDADCKLHLPEKTWRSPPADTGSVT